MRDRMGEPMVQQDGDEGRERIYRFRRGVRGMPAGAVFHEMENGRRRGETPRGGDSIDKGGNTRRESFQRFRRRLRERPGR